MHSPFESFERRVAFSSCSTSYLPPPPPSVATSTTAIDTLLHCRHDDDDDGGERQQQRGNGEGLWISAQRGFSLNLSVEELVSAREGGEECWGRHGRVGNFSLLWQTRECGQLLSARSRQHGTEQRTVKLEEGNRPMALHQLLQSHCVFQSGLLLLPPASRFTP